MVGKVKESRQRGLGKILKEASEVLRIEAEGILNLVDRLGPDFAEAVQWIYKARGRVIVTGIGKSGIVGQKIVATLNSTGTKAFFLHPVEALHGDLGMVSPKDIVLALSNSGETIELNVILPMLKNLGTRIIGLTGNTHSSFARNCHLVLYAGVEREACPLGLAPTASTAAMLALGDALAVVLINKRKFQAEDFHRRHPSGALGERLRVPIQRIMRTGKDIPVVKKGTSVGQALKEMDVKAMGATLVMADSARLVGIITDGDLRRGLGIHPGLVDRPVETIMSRNPKTIEVNRSVAGALEMMERHAITVLPVTNARGKLLGILHLHDLLGKGHIQFTL
ncbi:MAG TPA: KpsF/GutQ family sugar-phosphate isomerase [Syntrophobacteria bacterium]|nr:KpsF/GutQ family sugar-phosphate isomerase [Syntrophobacteria bacterium]